MCSLDWAMRCPDNVYNIIAGYAYPKVFQEELSMWIGWMSKDHLHQRRWASSNPVRAWIKQKGGGRWNSRSLFLTAEWRQGPPALSAPGLKAFRLGLELTALVPLVLRPSNYTTGFPGFPASIRIYEIYIFWLFLWRILTTTTAHGLHTYSVFTSFLYALICLCVFMCVCVYFHITLIP